MATGTSCLAEVSVMGRSLIPAPPESTSAFMAPNVPALRRFLG